jgi:serine protease inhibitor
MVVAWALMLGACTTASLEEARVVGDAARIDPELVAALSTEDAVEVASAVNAFGFELLHAVATTTENTVVSPVSVATLLTMLAAGAGGETAAQIADVLHLGSSRDDRAGALLGQLSDAEDVTLSVANALWVDDAVELEDDYRQRVRQRLGATVETADLGDRRTAAVIDAWVDDRTHGLIGGIADALGLPDPESRVVLVDAVHFLGTWSSPFEPDRTADRPFTLLDGTVVELPLMHHGAGSWGYARGDGFELLRLPYGADGRFGMEVLLPDVDRPLAEMVDDLDAGTWRAAVDALDDRGFDLVAMPAFQLGWGALIGEALAGMGMELAFSAAADFRPMSPSGMWLGDVVHETFVRVDETGTEAAAVTAADLDGSEEPGEAEVFRVDRPFVFTISDSWTGTILFLGVVTDPRG